MKTITQANQNLLTWFWDFDRYRAKTEHGCAVVMMPWNSQDVNGRFTVIVALDGKTTIQKQTTTMMEAAREVGRYLAPELKSAHSVELA